MNFPRRGSPAASPGLVGKFTIVVQICVDIVQQELPYDLYLFTPLAVEAGYRPLRVACVGCHLRDNACLLCKPRMLGIVNRRTVPNLLGESRVEAYSQMKIK